MLRMMRVRGNVEVAPGPFVAHPTGYPWRDGRLQSPLPFHGLNAKCAINESVQNTPIDRARSLVPSTLGPKTVGQAAEQRRISPKKNMVPLHRV